MELEEVRFKVERTGGVAGSTALLGDIHALN